MEECRKDQRQLHAAVYSCVSEKERQIVEPGAGAVGYLTRELIAGFVRER